MWWTRTLRRNLLAFAGISGRGGLRLLDAGCGAGGLLAALGREFPGAQIAGIDRDFLAASLARECGAAPVAQAEIERLPFRDGSFDAVFSADVLCHRGVDQDRALAEIRRCLKPGGRAVLNLPAYQWLYSAHDRAVDNARRYRIGEVRLLLRQAGFAKVRATYWNTLLFPLMVTRRKLCRGTRSEVALLPAPAEFLLGAAASLESRAVSWGLRLPFGGSIVAAGLRP